MGDLILDRVILAEGGPLGCVGGGEGRGGRVIVVEINEVGVGASVPLPSLGVPLGAVPVMRQVPAICASERLGAVGF